MSKDYEIFDHTADVGIVVKGNSLKELFEKAAYAMFDIILNARKIQSAGKYKVSISSPTIEDLMVDWLSELLYVFSTELFVMGKFDVNIKNIGNEYSLDAVCWGEPLKKRKHRIKTEIKAVTYHELEVDPKKGYAKILFDI